MRPGFWHKCRVGFRWCRISLWLVILVALCAIVWFNQIGLPDFLKARLVATLHEHGVELEFTRMRLHFARGIVAENVRIGSEQKLSGPVLTLAEAQLKLDFHAFLQRRVQVDGLYLREGRLFWPLSPTNRLVLENIQAALRFQTNDTWSLDHFQADFAGAKLALSGEIAHAPELRNWGMFRSSGSNNLASWQNSLHAFSDTLDQIHFSGQPHLDLTMHGDARDLHSFLIVLKVMVPAVQSPWIQAQDIQLGANLTAPVNVPARFDAALGFWTNLQPYRLEWAVNAAELQSAKLSAASLICDGCWSAPELTVSNLSVAIGDGRLDARGKLNVVTRELTFTNSDCFEVHALDALLPDTARKWLAEISWSQPPSLHIGGVLVLPAWTNSQPDWRGEVLLTIRLAGQVAVTNIIVHGASIDEAGAVFAYARRNWDFSDSSIGLGKTRLTIGGSVEDATKQFRGHIHGAVDPGVRPAIFN